MSDITERLQSVRDQVAKLAQLARNGQGADAEALAGKVDETLRQLVQELSSPRGESPTPKPSAPRAPRHELMACPRCSLRNFHFEKGSIRPAANATAGFEAHYRCGSCGYSAWQEVE